MLDFISLLLTTVQSRHHNFSVKNYYCLPHSKKKKKTYSATTVFPADVWADTNTDWLFSRHNTASFWNGSRMNLYSFAGFSAEGLRGTNSSSGGIATYNKRIQHLSQILNFFSENFLYIWVFVICHAQGYSTSKTPTIIMAGWNRAPSMETQDHLQVPNYLLANIFRQ